MAELGAPVPMTEEEKRRLGLLPANPLDLPQPEVFGQAVKAGEGLLGAPVNEAERTRLFEYRAQPFMEAAAKEKDLTNRYYESQGLRWSGGPSMRYNALQELEQKTWKNIGESVMVPQIEREQQERRANIALAGQLGGQQFQQGLAGRQMTLAETNSALDRAVAQGQATGTFTDPVTGLSQDTLTKQAQTFTQGIQERQTKFQEAESAMNRAVAQGQATGTFTDPVTGKTQDTLTKEIQAFNEKVQKAIQTGWWDTGVVSLEARKIAAELGLDPTTWSAIPADTPAPPPAGDGADDALAAANAETALITRLVPGIMASRIPLGPMRTIFSGVGTQYQDEFLAWLQSGEAIPFGKIQQWLGDNQGAIFALAEYLDGEGIGADQRVWFKDRPPAPAAGAPPEGTQPPGGPEPPPLGALPIEQQISTLATTYGVDPQLLSSLDRELGSGKLAALFTMLAAGPIAKSQFDSTLGAGNFRALQILGDLNILQQLPNGDIALKSNQPPSGGTEPPPSETQLPGTQSGSGKPYAGESLEVLAPGIAWLSWYQASADGAVGGLVEMAANKGITLTPDQARQLILGQGVTMDQTIGGTEPPSGEEPPLGALPPAELIATLAATYGVDPHLLGALDEALGPGKLAALFTMLAAGPMAQSQFQSTVGAGNFRALQLLGDLNILQQLSNGDIALAGRM